METQSNSNAALAEAYTKAYAEIQNVVKNSHNPHFGSNYADLSAVIDTVKPVFEKYGLAVYQAPGKLVELVGGGLAISVVSVLMHTSGAMLSAETQVPLGPKATAQAAGGAITYARRYALAAIAGIAQVDDDGNAASERPARRTASAAGSEDIRAAIEAATSLGAEGSTTAGELESLRSSVTESGDESLVKAFTAKRAALRKAKK